MSVVNETFESIVDGAGTMLLIEPVPENHVPIGSAIHMNNPFTGYSPGIMDQGHTFACPVMALIYQECIRFGLSGHTWVKDYWT